MTKRYRGARDGDGYTALEYFGAGNGETAGVSGERLVGYDEGGRGYGCY